MSVVPYLIGFHPSDSLVLVGFHDRNVWFVARADLPTPGDPGAILQLAEVARRQVIDSAVLVGYGPPARVNPAIVDLCVVLEEARLPVREALRVTGDRYWSYLCDDPACCPADGTPFRIDSSRVAASAVVAGCVALPDRAALERQIAPVEGGARDAIAAATTRAERQLRKVLDSSQSGDPASVRRRLVRGGERLLDRALRRYSQGETLADAAAAWLLVLLPMDPFTESAWGRVLPETASTQVALWRDLTRRAEPGYVPPAATLLGYAAWQAGDGALAGIAVQRALRKDPGYQPAQVMDSLLVAGTPPPGVPTRDARDSEANGSSRDGQGSSG